MSITEATTHADQRLGRLHDLPRARLGHVPTPIDRLENLSRHLGGPTILAKRDDCTGLGFGGNKVRQLEFYLGEAVAQDADTLLITGAVQSNFARTAAAAGRVYGMDCHIQHEERVADVEPAYRQSGNVLVERLLGATLHSYPVGEDEAGADARLHEIADDLRKQGKRPYVIHLGQGHPPLGSLGYVIAAQELIEQLGPDLGGIDEVFVASGSGSTHGGLLFGLRALGCDVPVTGICVRRAESLQTPRIANRLLEIATLLGIPSPVPPDDVRITDATLAPGYGKLNDATLEAMTASARCEALILDPVYTGKVMAGLIHAARTRAWRAGATLLFMHTGGQPALFGYNETLTKQLAAGT